MREKPVRAQRPVPVQRPTWARLTLLVPALSIVVSGACNGNAKSIEWRIAFDSPALRARAAVVEARIAKGGCKSDDFVYLSHFAPEKPGTGPPTLDRGVYGFVARAQDKSCRWFADGCTQITLPVKGSMQVSVRVSPLANEALDCDGPACALLSCGSGAVDAGGTPADAATSAADEDASLPAVDAGAPLVVLAFEAEGAGSLRAPLQSIHNDSASAGACIGFPADPMLTLAQQQAQKRSMPPSDDADGIAVYRFDVPRAGSYRLWGLVIASTVDQDSFWIEMDGTGFIQWNDIGHGDQWHWIDVRDFERRTERFAFDLARGRHTLRVSYREVGTLLDKLLLSSNLDYIP